MGENEIKDLKAEVYDMSAMINQLQQMINQKNQRITILEKEKKDGKEIPKHNNKGQKTA